MKLKFKIIKKLIENKNLNFLCISIFFTIFLAGLEIISLSMIVPLMDLILNKNIKNSFVYSILEDINIQDHIDINIVLFYFVLIYFLRTGFSIYINFFNQSCYMKIAYYVKNNLLKKYMNMRYENFVKKNYSEFLVNINQTASTFSYNFLGSIVSILSDLIIFCVILSVLLFHDAEKTIFIVLLFGTFGCIYYILTSKKIRSMGVSNIKFNHLTTKYLNEIFKGFKFIKISSKIEMYIGQINNIIQKNLTIERNLNFFSTFPRISLEFIAIIIFSLLLVLYSDENDKNIVSTMTLYAVAAIRIIPLLSKLLQSVQNFKYGRESLNVLDDALKNKDNNSLKDLSIKNNLKSFKKSIILENIFVNYEKNKSYVLNNFNLEINQGDKIAILGKSGSGKSTMVDLIIGFLKPESGKILIDGEDYSQKYYNLNDIIGYVPQNTFLFDETAEKNISLEFDEKKIDTKNLEIAIQKSELNDFIKTNKKLSKLNVGDDGLMISGGQKQRISIARAFYKNPEIMIFDEATNSLDQNTERKILQNILDMKELTVLFITHNLDLTKFFDKVINLDDKVY